MITQTWIWLDKLGAKSLSHSLR